MKVLSVTDLGIVGSGRKVSFTCDDGGTRELEATLVEGSPVRNFVEKVLERPLTDAELKNGFNLETLITPGSYNGNALA